MLFIFIELNHFFYFKNENIILFRVLLNASELFLFILKNKKIIMTRDLERI